MSADQIAKISDTLRGRTIIGIGFHESYVEDGVRDESNMLEVDAGEIFIILDDGTVIDCWNSEWGGIDLRQYIVKEDKIEIQGRHGSVMLDAKVVGL